MDDELRRELGMIRIHRPQPELRRPRYWPMIVVTGIIVAVSLIYLLKAH